MNDDKNKWLRRSIIFKNFIVSLGYFLLCSFLIWVLFFTLNV